MLSRKGRSVNSFFKNSQKKFEIHIFLYFIIKTAQKRAVFIPNQYQNVLRIFPQKKHMGLMFAHSHFLSPNSDCPHRTYRPYGR